MKKKSGVLFCLALLLSGCASAPQTALDGQKWQDEWTTVGTSLGVDAPDQLTLLDNKEALAADGLYYAAWVTGDSVPYENSEGENVDLYDAQLYLLTKESLSKENAESSCSSWIAAAKDNYEILSESTVTLNGQTYTWITYHCCNEENPYDRGVSAFGICGTTAVCAEFTCLESYTENLEELLTDFLIGCHYKAD